MDEELTATKEQNSRMSHDLMRVEQSIVELKNDLELEKIKVTGQTKLVEEKNQKIEELYKELKSAQVEIKKVNEEK